MTRLRRAGTLPLLGPLFLLALSVPATAQQDDLAPVDTTVIDPTPVDPALVDRPGRAFLSAADGRLWGLGDDYRAEFGPGFVEYTPILGESVPRNLPLRLSLDAVLRGGQVVVAAGRDPEPTQADRLATFAHPSEGLGTIEERYEVRPEGLELSVVLPRPVLGSGDLAVRLRVSTEWQAARGEQLRTLEFGGSPAGAPEGSGLRIGAVTGIDAKGRRCAGWFDYDGEHLEMVLPAAFVDAAAWPLVIDPLIGGVQTAGRSFSDYDPDIAYNAFWDMWGILFETRISASDSDIWLMQVRGSDGTRLQGAALGVGSGRQRLGALANSRNANVFIAVWHNVVGSVPNIEGRSVDPFLLAVQPRAVLGSARFAATGPDIGGVSHDRLDGTSAVVVWNEPEWGRRTVATLSWPTPLAPIQVRDVSYIVTSTDPHDRIAITKSGGSAGRYLVAWTAGDSLSVRACDFRAALDPGTLSFGVRLNGASTIDLDGDGREALVVASVTDPVTLFAADVVALHVDYQAGRPLRSGTGGLIPLAARRDRSEVQTAVAHLAGDRYGVVWTESVPSTGDFMIHGATVLAPTGQVCGTVFSTSFAPTGFTANLPAVASKASGGSAEDQGLFAWEAIEVSTGHALLSYQRMTSTGPGGPMTDLGGGCGLGGVAGTTGGPFRFGNRDFAVLLQGANGSVPTLASLTLAFGANPRVFGCGPGCELLLPVVDLSALVDVQGNARVSIPLPCDGALDGTVVHAQFACITPGTDPCGLAPVSLSNRLRMELRD